MKLKVKTIGFKAQVIAALFVLGFFIGFYAKKLKSQEDLPILKKLEIGQTFIYELKLQNTIDFANEPKQDPHKLNLSARVELRVHQAESNEKLMSLTWLDQPYQQTNEQDKQTWRESLYFLWHEGRITQFYSPIDPKEEFLASSQLIALAFQWPSNSQDGPNQEISLNGILDFAWQHQGKRLFSKNYSGLRESAVQEILPTSQASYQWGLKSFPETITQTFHYRQRSRDFFVEGSSIIKLTLLESYVSAQTTKLSQILTQTYTSSAPGDLSHESAEQKQKTLKKILGPDDFSSLVAQLNALEDLEHDAKLPNLLRKWQAILQLQPESLNEMLELIKSSRDPAQALKQWTILSGALQGLEAKDRELPLIEALQSRQSDEEWQRLGAYALSGLTQSSKASFDYLQELSKDNKPEIRDIAFLALGSAARSNQESESIRQLLRQELEQISKPSDLANRIAALGNAHDPRDLKLLLKHLRQADSNVQEQVLFALGTMPSQQAYQALLQFLNERPSETLQILILDAMAFHKQEKSLTADLREQIMMGQSLAIQLRALQVLSQINLPTEQLSQELDRLQRQETLPTELKREIAALLLLL